MAKQKPEDLTIGYNAKVLAAIKTIGQGLMDLADALVAPSASEEKPETRPAREQHPRSQPSPAEDTAEDEETADETPDKELDAKLSDLQELARDLIKAGRRPALLKILEKHDLDKVSAAPVGSWKTLKKELEEAAA